MTTDDDRVVSPASAAEPEIPVVTGDTGIDRLLSAAGRHLDATATVTSIDPAEVIDRIFHDDRAHETRNSAATVDLTALQEDDALLDALGGTNPDVSMPTESTRPSLEALLVAWRQDADAAPIGDLVDTDAADAAIVAGNRPQRRLCRRHLVPVATAAAVLMITFTGVGVAARDAQPGDMLWGVAQVLYTDHTRAVVAASSAREDLNTAEGAIENGNRNAAEAALRSAQEQMRGVDDEHGLSDLRAAYASLTARIDDNEHLPSPPNSPAPPTTPPTPEG
ncbi:anti-sigma-D factor RsdA [Saccharopolyspora spinosa]|uniref:Anti-sigma-D factor RsdA-like protein n=1 Tax=Saccharopolyspora spinosa TaxID=60894 RepID=A0A2N3XZ95_SACSN|nr:anti-sigma-D factor RsdA [Saccharopolyspora spinosa]PKW16006.1 anti-sigma-D factor RsdA-like protein [Saccharopolyspora spinosa]